MQTLAFKHIERQKSRLKMKEIGYYVKAASPQIIFTAPE